MINQKAMSIQWDAIALVIADQWPLTNALKGNA